MKSLTLPAVIANLETVNAFVEESLDAVQCPPRSAVQLMVALEELFVNVARYAYAPDTGSITVRIDTQPGKAVICLIDRGIPFDPLSAPDPDTTLPANARPIGGLGLFMVKKSMDLFTYERANDQNIVTIAKKW